MAVQRIIAARLDAIKVQWIGNNHDMRNAFPSVSRRSLQLATESHTRETIFEFFLQHRANRTRRFHRKKGF